MQHTPIITEEKLHANSDFAESRGLIPELVLRLICASVQNPNDLRIPVAGSVGQRGWDGILVSSVSFDPYVPEGRSFLEIGTGSDPQEKATEEFRKRTAQTSEEEQSGSTFIFITPRSGARAWDSDSQRAWLENRKASKWKEIRIIDGTKLVQWMYLFPEVDFWLADQFGLPTQGLTTPALHWKKLRFYGAPPELKPDAFLISRGDAVQQLTKLFQGETRELLLQTRYPDEGVDFVAAALASLPIPEQSAFASRCLIIDDPATWKVMCTLKTSHVLVAHPSLDVAGSGADLRQHAKTYGHSVIFFGNAGTGVHGNSIRLHEADPHELERALQESGYDSERARQIAARCGGRIPGLKRLLLDLSASPEWVSGFAGSELAFAVLIGQWDANRADDIAVAEDVLGKSYGEWIRALRPMTLRPDPPLIQRDERWKFVSRFEGWQALGPLIFDTDLERFEKVALQVLGERDPMLKLAPDERWKFMPDTKRRRYSDILREGFAETLALLGSFPRSLSSCSIGRPEATAAIAVRLLFEHADWELWATLNDVLPLLAEAAPEQFLWAVEHFLGTEGDNPFSILFKQERAGISGKNYMTGMLWALETLAWNPDYLVRVSLILAELAAIDPGGNWSNRPSNSLVDILLPWHPQTVAGIPKRTAAVSTVLSEQRDTGWRLVLALLPGARGVTSGTRRPSWREYIPETWKDSVTNRDYHDQVVAYANLAVEVALADNSKLVELLEHTPSLPDAARRRIFEHIGSTQITGLSDSERRPIWENLVKLVSVHRRYSEADWAMDTAAIAAVESAANAIAPKSPAARYHRLFGGLEFELFEEKDDYETQNRNLALKRQDAIREILASLGIDGVIAFARSVDAPSKVGVALGAVGNETVDREMLPSLLEERDLQDFTSGFVWERVRTIGWEWIDRLSVGAWTKSAKITLLTKLPFQKQAWGLAVDLLADEASLYWEQVHANPYEVDGADLISAAEILLQHERPRAAVQCLHRALYAKLPLDPSLVIRALRESVSSEEPLNTFDQHATRHLIKWLQTEPATDEQELFHVEWSYLPLLDRLLGHVTPKTLEGRLARDPSFFCEVIRSTFRSDKEDPEKMTPSEDKQRIAKNAYRLLHEWQTPPGTTADGTWSEAAFSEWIGAVKKSSSDSGHYGVAMSQVGEVLTYVPSDPTGLWIHKAVAASLDEKDAEQMRGGFTIKLFNRRGAHGFSAGHAEREIAAGYRKQADAVEDAGYSRLASALRELAKSYDGDADRDTARGALGH